MKRLLRRFTSFLLLGLLTFGLLSACNKNVDYHLTSAQESTQDCRIVQHTMGETCIPVNPQRIVTLWTTILANTLALGIKPIASTYYTGEPFPKYLQGKVDGIEFIGNLTEPSLEKILQLKPDFVLANSRLDNIYDPLSRIAPTVVMSFPIPPPPWKQQLDELAKALNKEEASKKLMDEYWQRIETLKQTLGNRRNQIQVSVASLSAAFGGIWAYGEKSPVGTVLKDIGLQRPLAQSGDFYYIENISEERLSDIDGDILFFLVRGEKGAKEMLQNLQQKPLWRQLKAVQQNKVYFVDAGHWHALDILAMNAVIDDLYKYLVNAP